MPEATRKVEILQSGPQCDTSPIPPPLQREVPVLAGIRSGTASLGVRALHLTCMDLTLLLHKTEMITLPGKDPLADVQ